MIVITGMPCSGKTWLARQLSVQLNLPLVAKDDIKEHLFESLGWSDREWSKKLGRAAFDLLFHFVEEELRSGKSLIVEGRFFPQYHRERFQEIFRRCPCKALVIECVADGDILLQRFLRRSFSGERHPGHVDHTSLQEAETAFLGEQFPPFDLGCRYIPISTNDFARVDLPELLALLRQEMAVDESPPEAH